MSNIGPFVKNGDSDTFPDEKDAQPKPQASAQAEAADAQGRPRPLSRSAECDALPDQAADFCKIENRREPY